MSTKPIDKSFVSDIDRFLAEHDKKHPKKSSSQLKEIVKHERISRLRDNVDQDNKKSD